MVNIMKNTEESKKLLQKAFDCLPTDFALSEVRYHMLSAMNKLRKVEHKREKRIEAQQNLPKYDVSPNLTKHTLDIIDRLIEQEKAKITKNDPLDTDILNG